MNNQSLDEVKSRHTFFDGLIHFMACVMERNVFPIVFINAESGNNGMPKVSVDIFDSDVRCAEIGFSIVTEFFRMIIVDIILDLMERRTDSRNHFFKKNFSKSITEKRKVKVFYRSLGGNVAGTTFRDKSMDVRVPF